MAEGRALVMEPQPAMASSAAATAKMAVFIDVLSEALASTFGTWLLALSDTSHRP